MNHSLDSVVIILLAAVLAVIICRRLHIPAMLGYLVVGFLAGPGVLRLIPQTGATDFLGEIGIVFLMFSIGLEFSLPKLRAMRQLVIGLGGMQVLLTLLSLMAIMLWYGLPLLWAFALASALTMSSTAIVSRLLSEHTELGQPHGQMVMGVLLMQDIAVVPLMILLHALAGDTSHLWVDLGLALVKMIVVLVVLLYLGDKLMRPWFKIVARQNINELFMLNVLLVTLGVAYLTELAGLSLALGAFVAGMLISETQYRYQVEDDIRPFRDILLGFFFITVGMKLNIGVLWQNWLLIVLILLLLLLLKAAIIYLVAKRQGHSSQDSLTSGLYLAQGGEFGFVLLALATQDQILDAEMSQIGMAAILVSMLLAPLVIKLAPRIVNKLFKSSWDMQAVDLHHMLVESMSKTDHVILVGFGQSGQTVARLLQQENINYYALDLDVDRVQAARLAGEPIAFGDAKRKEILLAAGLQRAKMVVITLNHMHESKHILATVLNLSPTLPVLARSPTQDEMDELTRQGADEVVADDKEMGLVLAAQTLLGLGIPFEHISHLTQQVRRDRYRMLADMYRGHSDDTTLKQDISHIHRSSLQLPQGAYAIDRRIDTLPLAACKVALTGIRRGSLRLRQLEPDFVLAAEDVLIVVGTPANISTLENWLLQGKF